MGIFERFYQLTQQPAQNEEDQPQQQQMPQVDTSDPINSLANLLVTPAEREAQQQKLLKNKRQMIAWTGLFDGLRQLANLYTASKGANNMQFTDNPYQNIEQSYKDEQQRQDNLFNYRDKYAQTLYTLQRQGLEDARKKSLTDAQVKWYDDRSETAKTNAELARYKSVRVIKQQDGSLMKFDPVEGTVEPLTEADPLYVDYMKSRINANNKRTGLIGAPVTTTSTNAKGETTTSVRSYGNNKPAENTGSSSSAGKYDKYKKPKK